MTNALARQPAERRIGKDELNLTEFPFAVVAPMGKDEEAPTKLEFRDGAKEWIVTSEAEYGLPQASDVEVYLVLMELSKGQNFPRTVEFTRYHLLQRLGWDRSSSSYQRLQLALDRLVGVRIRTKNAFYAADQKRYERRQAFGILEAYDITDPIEGDGTALPFRSWARWSEEIHRNLEAGYIKSIDLNLCLNLRSPIALNLYRYLDAKRGGDGKTVYQIGLFKLCHEHLGLSRKYRHNSELKRRLSPANDKLVQVGFLSRWHYEEMKSRPGESMVVYHFAPPLSRGPAVRELPAGLAPLVQRLVDHQVTPRVAQELVEADAAEVERQLTYLKHRKPRDPAAVLVKAIREQWIAPLAVRQEEGRQRETRQTRVAMDQEREEREQIQRDNQRWQKYWEGLPEETRERFTTQAVELIKQQDPALAKLYQERPSAGRMFLIPYLQRLVGWPLG